MEKFVKFKEEVSLKNLAQNLHDDRIIILRESKVTGTVQIKILGRMSDKQIKQAFVPYTVTKIYREFPYPLKGDGILNYPLFMIRKLFEG